MYIYICIISTIVFSKEAELPQSIHKDSQSFLCLFLGWRVVYVTCGCASRRLLSSLCNNSWRCTCSAQLRSTEASCFCKASYFWQRYSTWLDKQVKNESKRNVERQKIIKTQEQTRLYSYSTLWIQNMALPKSHQFLYFIFENGAMLWTW